MISSLINYRAYRDGSADNSSLFRVNCKNHTEKLDRNKETRLWNRETTFMATRLSVVSGVHLNITRCVVLRTRPPYYVLAPVCVRACNFTGRTHDWSMPWRRYGCVITRLISKARSSLGRTARCYLNLMNIKLQFCRPTRRWQINTSWHLGFRTRSDKHALIIRRTY